MISLKHKIENFFPKHKIKIHFKGITTLFGAGMVNFLIGAIFSLCTLAVYEISYIKEKDDSMEIENLTFYYPIELFFQCISSFISGIIYKKLGLHLTNLIGIIILCFGYYLMYISSSFSLDLISMVFSGIGTGIIFYPSTTNAYEWFKGHNGLIVGIMETMISLGSFFFSYLGERIINKNQIKSNEENNLYSFEIAKNIKKYLIILIICLIITFFLSFILMFEKKDKKYNELIVTVDNNSKNKNKEINNKNIIEKINSNVMINNNNNNKDKDSKMENININEFPSEDKNNNLNKDFVISAKEGELIDDSSIEKKTNINKDRNVGEIINNDKKYVQNTKETNFSKNKDLIDISNDEKISQKRENIKKEIIEPYLEKNINNNIKENKEEKKFSLFKIALKSGRLKLFCAIVILQAPVSNMAFTLYREIGEIKKINTKYLQLIGSYYFIFECLSSFIFGILCDYIKIKYLLLFINIVGTITGYIFCLTFNNSLLFFLTQIFISFVFGGYYSIKDFYLMKVFGKDIYIELSSFVSLMDALAINILSPLTYFILSKFDNKDKAYWILFISFGSLNLIGLILNLFLKETKIDLNERIKNQKEKQIK